MKDLVSCFSEHAVRISDVAACSGSGAANAAAAGGAPEAGGGGRAPAVSAVTTAYRSRLSASGKELLIDVTWSRAPDGPALSVAVHEAATAAAAAASRHHRASNAAAALRHLHKKKGSGTFTAGSCVVGVFWDYAAARYADTAGAGAWAGPEPTSGFYVAVVADAEFVLLLGDLSRGYVDRLHGGIPIAGSRLARRRERFVGCGCWSTRARFLESGDEHEIGVVVRDGDAEAWVTVDGRKVVQLRRLRWNFRGSHTIFLDGGAPVDMTWDLHGWLFHAAGAAELPPHPSSSSSSSSSSCAVFTFQARGASETTKLWTDDDCFFAAADDDGEETDKLPVTPSGGRRQKAGGGGGASSGQGFCLLIQGFRGFSKST
ncbi:hypothetical protein BDA96_06G074000 [Sorghum bicolor]|uniref:Uncharacterized protein n=2 Tax=Sorghum bicolor TaxID=4558 RepID=A0A921UB91_SORBI|nr:uncharacterized protein LOC8072697 [Sorghum bicolor]KAG0525642.1 hypothetical protein BDA96_06G074000 [Sorghum bicolor]KXG26216.2 hypothetical protein SORBI_3006G066300 [Sorghum bicolor]|eukprot:XP_021318342.1 uncharacterized protein LOC8072697 [Sorghum bicolor]